MEELGQLVRERDAGVEKNGDTFSKAGVGCVLQEEGLSLVIDLFVTSLSCLSSSCCFCSCCCGVMLDFLALIVRLFGQGPADPGFCLLKTLMLLGTLPSVASSGDAGGHKCPLE